MDKTVINFRLSDLRKAKHITQGELAEFVGTSFQTISKWENGITMPDITVLPVLAAFFEVSIDELLGIKPLKGDVYSSEETTLKSFGIIILNILCVQGMKAGIMITLVFSFVRYGKLIILSTYLIVGVDMHISLRC